MLYAILLGTIDKCSYYINGFPISPSIIRHMIDKGANITLIDNGNYSDSDEIIFIPFAERKEDSN